VRAIERYKIKTRGYDTPIGEFSGGNVQRAVLARELGGEVDIMIAVNPCFGHAKLLCRASPPPAAAC
jgi:ABC-type uncharacterized transport system ATPase subunit